MINHSNLLQDHFSLNQYFHFIQINIHDCIKYLQEIQFSHNNISFNHLFCVDHHYNHQYYNQID